MIHTVDVALSQLGVREATGRNDGIPSERYARGERIAWCAAFLIWCNENSDDPRLARNEREFYALRSVQAFEDEMKRRGWWASPASRIVTRNDVMFFARRDGSDAGPGRHVGIVNTVEGDVIHTVEGNRSNEVGRGSYNMSDPKVVARVTGFARLPRAA